MRNEKCLLSCSLYLCMHHLTGCDRYVSNASQESRLLGVRVPIWLHLTNFLFTVYLNFLIYKLRY